MSKPLRYGPVTCPITGKTLTTYSQLTAVNYYSPKAGEVVTKFLNLDNQAPEVKVHTDAIRNAISELFKLHAQSPEVIAYRAGVSTDTTVEDKAETLEPAETF